MPRKFPKQTREVLALKKKKLLDTAREMMRMDPRNVRVMPLALAFGVSSLTARKWMVAAGIETTQRKGRPARGESFGYQDVMDLVAAAARRGEETLEHAAEAVQTNPETEGE